MPSPRQILLALCVLLLPATPVLATTPRVTALGGAGDYLEDDSGYLRWFGALGDYGNAATVDFGHFNIYKGYHDLFENTLSGPGIRVRQHLGQGLGTDLGTLAVFWQRQDTDLPLSTLFRIERKNTYGFTYARRVGPVQLGINGQNCPGDYLVRHDVSPFPAFDIQYLDHRRSWGLGARMDLSPSAYLDVALRTEKISVETALTSEHQSTSREFDGLWSTNLRSRLFLRLGESTALVPLLEYLHEQRPSAARAMTTFGNLDGVMVRLGCGLNHFPDVDHAYFVTFEWENVDSSFLTPSIYGTREFEMDWNAFRLQVGSETRTLPWLTLRSSVGYLLSRGKGMPSWWDLGDRDGLDIDDLDYSLGVGLHLPGWDLDAAITSTEPRPGLGTPVWGTYSYETTWLSVSLRYTH